MTQSTVAGAMDAFTVYEIDGERVIVTLPNMAGQPGSDEDGSAVFGGNYIADLVQNAIAFGVVDAESIRVKLAAGEADLAHYAKNGLPNRSISMSEFNKKSSEVDQYMALNEMPVDAKIPN